MGKNISNVQTTFLFCDGGSCQKAKGELAIREARAYLRNQGLWDSTHTIKTKCNGRCEDAPTCIVQPGNFWYKNITPKKAVSILKSHLEQDEYIEEYLLYKEGWSVMLSDNERTLTLPVFKPKIDPEYGAVLVARAFASDQHIYPLLQYFFQQPRPVAVQVGTTPRVMMNTPHQVDYSDPYEVKVSGTQLEFSLTIAALPKTISEAIAARKVSVAEVIWLEKKEGFTKIIQFKNKKGEHLIRFFIMEEDRITWEHVLNIYLSMSPDNIRVEECKTIG